MANVQGPKLELEIALNGIDDVNSKLTQLSNTIKLLNHVNVEITFDSKIEAVKKSISKTVKDIQQTIAKINENPIDFKVANKDDFNVFKAGLGDIDTALDGLSNKATALATQMKAITSSGKTLAMAAGTKSADSKDTDKTNSYAAATERLTKALNKLHEVKPIELKFDPTNINAILGTLEHAVTKLNLVRNALGTALDLSKVKIPVPKKNSIDVNDDYFKRMGESISNSINNSMGKLDIGKQLNTSLAQIDFKGMADGINAALNKVYEQDKINKIPVVPTIDDKTIKGLKTRITNLIKEIKESDGKIPLELTLDLDKLRERLKVARGELDRFKKTDRFKPPLTLNLNDFKEKIKAAKEALKKFRESEETTVNLKIAINDANKVLADFNTANSSLLTDKTINVTLAYSEFDKGIKHVQEALASLKDMTIHINSNVKDVIAKEKVKEEELKAEKAEKKKQQQEAKEQKPAPDSKENYRTMLDNLKAHPLSNGKNPEGNTTLGGRLKTVEMLQSAIELGKTNPTDPNAFLVGFKDEGFLRAQHEWLEKAMHAVGANKTVSQAQKAMKAKMKDPNGYNALMENLMAFPLSDGKNITTTATVQKRLAAINKLLSVHAQGLDNPISPRSWTANAEQLQFLNDERDSLIEKKNALAKGMSVEEYREYNAQQAFDAKHKNDSAWTEELDSQRKARRESQERSDLSSSKHQREAKAAEEQKEYDNAVRATQEEAELLAGFANGRAEVQAENERMSQAAENARKRLEQQKAQQQKAEDEEEVRRATQATKEQQQRDKEQKAKQSEIDKLERKLQDIEAQYNYSFLKANPMQLQRYMQMGNVERDTIAKLNELNGSGSNHTPVFGNEADYNHYVTQFPNSTFAAQMANGRERAQTQRENDERKEQQRQARENARAQKEQDRQETAEATRATKEQERIDKEKQKERNRTIALNVQERFQEEKEQRKQQENLQKEIDRLEHKLQNLKSQYGYSFYNPNPMSLEKYMRLGDTERSTIAELNKLKGSPQNYTPVFGGSTDYKTYVARFTQGIQDSILKAEEKLKRIQQNYGFALYRDKPISLEQYMKYDTREQEAITQLNELHKKAGTTGNYSAVFGGQQGYDNYSSGYQVAKIKNDILKAEEKLKRIQQNYGFALYADKPMTLQRYMRYDAREQEAIAELNKLHGQAGTTGNYSAVFNGQQGYANYSNSYKVDKVEDELDKLQQKLADSKLGERPMKEQQFMANSTREQELIAELNKLNGTKRNSVYNGSNGYQQYLDDMRQIGKITAEEEKRNNLIQRRKDIAHEYSQELRKQNQLLQSGREVSQKEIDASERRIENIRRKWDNTNWGANETKPELRQSYLHGRNAQEINQQNSVRNAMAWQSQYFSTANSKVGTLTASLEKLYTELKRNPGDSGLKGSIKETTRELARAQREAKEVTKEMNKLNGTLSAGIGNKLKWISSAFGFNESYDILRDAAEVFSGINEGMANLRTVMPAIQHGESEGQKRTKAEADAAMAAQSRIMVSTAGDYGIGIDETIESARLWGRMYKDQNTVNLLTAQSAKLAVADNFSVEESTKAVEAAMFQFGMQAKTTAEALTYSNRIIDVYTRLSHNAGVSAQDLAAGVERSGAVAHQAGMSFEFLNALIAQGTRSTALSGLTNHSPFMLETA